MQSQSNKTKLVVAEQICLSFLDSCDGVGKLTQIHAYVTKSGVRNNPVVLTKFATVSHALKSIDYASSLIFERDADRGLYDAFLYNTVIRGFAHTSESKPKALSVYRAMLADGVSPNNFTYPFVLKACAGIGSLRLGQSAHCSAVKFGFADDCHVGNTTVHMYARCSDGEGIEDARKMFDEMPERNLVCWSAMIGGYARAGMSAESITLFREMRLSGMIPDEITMVSVLSACTDSAALELGKWMESYIEKESITKSAELQNAMIDMFAKCGEVEKAMSLFRGMEEKKRSIISWTSIIGGMAMNGQGWEAASLFEEMVRGGTRPDSVAFIGVLTGCSHSGLVERGRLYLESMEKEYGVAPGIEHYGCVVDMLCRAGRVREALDLIRDMPVRPNAVVLRMVASACRAHGELQLGQALGRALVQGDPDRPSNYVLLSDIYANMSMWDHKARVRRQMEDRGVAKRPGSTMMEVQMNELHPRAN